MSVRLAIVVTHGPDVGARIDLLESPRVIGRAKDAALPLTDPAISRRHLEVLLDGGEAIVRALPGAAPFYVDGQPVEEARLARDARFVIGNTMFAIALDRGAEADIAQSVTLVQRLLEGAGADVRGLAAVFTLVEALDQTDDEGGLVRALASWARDAAGALAAAPVDEDAIGANASLEPLRRGDLAITSTGDRACSVFVPAAARASLAIRFDLPLAADDVSMTVKRMLIVCGRVFAQRLAAIRDLSRAREEGDAMRAQAIGSARAFLGESEAAHEVVKLLPKLSASDAAVLLLGESGSGKTFLARLIHESGPRAKEPLRVVNCAAIPENLLESALFGHDRGAFTGADSARAGVLESAGRGTVLLDEIGELPLASQAKLLRVLEERVFERVGSNKEIPLRARVLAATNRDLTRAVEERTFRGDLFFRVSVISVRVPALRERGEDVVVLARRLLADLASNAGRRVCNFDASALAILRAYPWPGNVRELRNAIEHAIVLGEGEEITASDLPPSIRVAHHPALPSAEQGDSVALPARLEYLEARAIEAALKATGGNRTRAAALLGINRVTLYKKLNV